MQIDTTCTKCGKIFERNDDRGITYYGLVVGREENRPLCYNCALDEVTGGKAPEEGDFNSALLMSGEMNNNQWKWMQEDFRAAERGGSVFEPYEDDTADEYDAPAWCYVCNRDIAFCECVCNESGAPFASNNQHLCDSCDLEAQDKFEYTESPVEEDLHPECQQCGASFEGEGTICPACEVRLQELLHALVDDLLRLDIFHRIWWEKLRFVSKHWRILTRR